MEYEIVHLKERLTAGLSARTNNTSPDMAQVIGGLWKQFYTEGIYESIPGKTSGKSLGIYTDYDGRETDDYTILTACEIAPDTPRESIPPQAVVRRFPAGTYAKFVVKGPMDTAVTEFWQELWQMNLPRTFVDDFEEYQNADMEQAEIHMYISIRASEESACPESCCGIRCSTCKFREDNSCRGCLGIEKPFWSPEAGCPIKQCCESHTAAHCGLCREFPCDLLKSFAYHDEQGDDGMRILQCRMWKNIN